MNKYLSKFESVDAAFGLQAERSWVEKQSATDLERWRRSLPAGQSLRTRLVP